MTDITELAQSEINDALAQLKQISEYPTPSTQYARVLRKYILALVEALEKAQTKAIEQGRTACELFDEVTALRQRIAELESRTVNIKFAPIQVEELGNVRDGKKHPYMFGAGYNSAVIHCESVIQQELDAKGIKWEAE